MMSCKKYQGMLSAYLDKELSKTEAEGFEAHISECSECASQARKLSLGIEFFRSIGGKEEAHELSPYLPERIAAMAMEKRQSQRSWRVRFAFAFGTTALVVGLFTGYILGPRIISPPGGEGVSVASIKIDSESMGFEIDGDHFILHSKDKRGERGIDLKF